MPKVKAWTVSKSPESSFFVLKDGKKCVLARPSAQDLPGSRLALDVCGGELTDISPNIWEMAVELLSSVLVKGAPSVLAKAKTAPASAFTPALGMSRRESPPPM
ncbi:hypothetical protein DFH09DRAFT_1337328 [Mycena vulgaris]|nr:hypothetical protein DFH09DRAFT_1337328 [Mycena vulgaris]